MGFIIFIIVIFFILIWVVSAAFNLVVSRIGPAWKMLRPYIFFWLIAGLVAAFGLVVDVLFGGAWDVFFFLAKVVAVLAAAVLCLHLIYVIGKIL